MTAMPLLIGVLCVMAIAYRYYSAFLAARVAALDDLRATPARQLDDGHNYHPTNKWVLFGHHFAAISGAGPLIGPVLAAQFGYLPGLIWIIVGVCLAGAVQDFLVLGMSIRRGGKSLAQIAFSDVGRVAGVASTVAILFILIIALAGLGKVVVKALGGEEVKFPVGAKLVLPPDVDLQEQRAAGLGVREHVDYVVPAGAELTWGDGKQATTIGESFKLRVGAVPPERSTELDLALLKTRDITPDVYVPPTTQPSALPFKTVAAYRLPPGAVRLVPGSSWGTFTIALTIPIALFVGLYMYKIRPGRVVEASVIGGILTLGATFLGGMIPGSGLQPYFELSDTRVIWAMAMYGFVASVLPVWVLLCPRDYLSSFLKIGTIALLVGGVILANPKLEAPAINGVFLSGGPTVGTGSAAVPGRIFPFLFIVIMCGAISGFHALVSSGTTPKMIGRERDARMIGYGAMLIEGLVAVVAMTAAATLPVKDYFHMNVDLAVVSKWEDKILQVGGGGGPEHLADYERLTQESLRGRTGGAVTLAVGMAHIFDGASQRLLPASAERFMQAMWKYWYHFAIMFEALFILTTIDTGTRIGRFLLQEMLGKVHPSLGLAGGGWFAALLSTGIIVAGWSYFIAANSMAAIWPMFGVANQMLAVIALAIVTAYLCNEGRLRYAWVTVLPMFGVMTTTSTAAVQMLIGQVDTIRTQVASPTMNWTTLVNAIIQGSLIAGILACGVIVIIASAVRVWRISNGFRRDPDAAPAGDVMPTIG